MPLSIFGRTYILFCMDSNSPQRQPTSNSLFGGLKKLLFKGEENDMQSPVDTVQPQPAEPTAPAPRYVAPNPTIAAQPDNALRERAYQMLESINQPGVDFMEVWNAAEDNGGATPASVKAAFNALKYADRSLTKEKVLATGQHYCAELQRVFDADALRKAEEKARLEAERTGRRQSLTQDIAAEEAQIAALQKSLAQKREELHRIDADYDPRLHDIDQKIAAGRATIVSLTDEMNVVLRIVKTEL
jgi:hypothetical protein